MDKTTERAGRILKVLKLAGTPGMDAVAVKLNCSSLTYAEEQQAKRWKRAFELAAEEGSILRSGC